MISPLNVTTRGVKFLEQETMGNVFKAEPASSSPPGMKVAGPSSVLIEALGKPSICLSSLGGRQGDGTVTLWRQLGSK